MLHRALIVGSLLILASGATACHRHKHAPPDLSASQEPDKVLYEKSLEDIQNKRYDVARLTLQTLLNTYPDSDYLPAAKLAIADSYYTEGTTASLTHAEVEYKDFITFFPNAPEAAFAQYRAAMCHYRQMGKADRDPTHAQRAEQELQQLLRDFPDSPYAAEGEKRLIQAQEVLADGQFRIGRFYYIKQSYKAAASRLANLVERHPNYSHRDEALHMLGRAYATRLPALGWPGDDRIAAEYYARLIREHPLSEYLPDAKAELARLSAPIPEPDPALLARAQTVEPVVLEEEGKPGMLDRMFGLVSGRPDLSEAAPRLGPPPLEPAPDVEAPIPQSGGRGRPGGSVAVQTLEEMPSGTVVETPSQGGEAATDPASKPEGAANPEDKDNQTPEKKKSFWRKLIPFI